LIRPAAGAGGSLSVLAVATEPVQPSVVREKLLYVPADKPVSVKALLLTFTFLGLPDPV
jgi:hypothetical protein